MFRLNDGLEYYLENNFFIYSCTTWFLSFPNKDTGLKCKEKSFYFVQNYIKCSNSWQSHL